jgi:ADP-heptose:LPS heptosyltransferase
MPRSEIACALTTATADDWSGWHNKKTGASRSIDLSLFAPLLTRPEVRWVSLQYGDPAELERQAEAAGAPILIDRRVD